MLASLSSELFRILRRTRALKNWFIKTILEFRILSQLFSVQLVPATGASPALVGLATGIQPLILDEKEVGSRRLEFGSGGEAGKDDASSSRVRWKGQALPRTQRQWWMCAWQMERGVAPSGV